MEKEQQIPAISPEDFTAEDIQRLALERDEISRQLSNEIKEMSDQDLLRTWSGNCDTKMGMHDESRNITEDDYDHAVYAEISQRKLLEKK